LRVVRNKVLLQELLYTHLTLQGPFRELRGGQPVVEAVSYPSYYFQNISYCILMSCGIKKLRISRNRPWRAIHLFYVRYEHHLRIESNNIAVTGLAGP
jgi:hypothetical protein